MSGLSAMQTPSTSLGPTAHCPFFWRIWEHRSRGKGNWDKWEGLKEARAALVLTSLFLPWVAQQPSAQSSRLVAASPAHASVCNQTGVTPAFLCLKPPIAYRIKSKPLRVP